MIPVIATGILIAGLVSLNITGAEATNWEVFRTVHIFNPNAAGNNNWRSWSAANWISWLYAQEPLRRQANNGRGDPLKTKGLHTVIIADEQEVLNAFNGNLLPYPNNCVWSNRPFPNVIMFEKKSDSDIRVFRTPNAYIAAGLDENNRPVHVGATSDSSTPGRNDMHLLAEERELTKHPRQFLSENMLESFWNRTIKILDTGTSL